MVSQTNLSGEQARFVGTAIVAQQLEELCLAGGALESWHACRNRLVQIGRMTLTEVANWLDADAGCVRLLQP